MAIPDRLRRRKFVIVCALATILLYLFYLDGLSKNPPGFYLDESFISYQAYLIAQTGRNEFGELLPSYFRAFENGDGTFDSYMNPPYIYGLAALNLVFSPSVILSRTFSATLVFLACLLLGWLSARMSGRPAIGVIIACTALVTPWFFELSRLVFEVAIFPLALVLFLTALFGAHRTTAKWTWVHCVTIAAGLALVTYSYTTGRFLGPAFAIGLVLFITSKQRLADVAKTWGIYVLMLVPAIIFMFYNPGAWTARYYAIWGFKPEMSFLEKATTFIGSYFTDIGFDNLLLSGDPVLRHHVPVMGMLFAATVLLGLMGLNFASRRARYDAWYRFLLFGLVLSVVPGALTAHRGHMLRLSAFPVFIMLVTVPVLGWLFDLRDQKRKETNDETNLDPEPNLSAARPARRLQGVLKQAALPVLLISIAVQAVVFHIGFRQRGEARGEVFDDAYPFVLAEAIRNGSRPIYLEDGHWGPAYIHGYFFGAVQNVDRSAFARRPKGGILLPGSLVLSSSTSCTNCQVVYRRGSYLLYKTK